MAPKIASPLIAAVSVAAALFSAAPATAAHKPTHPRRSHVVCVSSKAVKGHHARDRVCTVRVAHSTTARRTRAKTASVPVSPLSGPMVVGLDPSIVGWGDVAGRFNQVVSQTGAKWMRQDFFWSTIEPRPGVFDFTYYDQFVLLAAQHNVHLLPLMFDVPTWAGANYDSIPADPSAYAAYVAAVVHRYGPHGSFWAAHPSLASYAIHTFELWNEPYYNNGNNGDYNPARYANLVKAAGIAGRAADSSARFLLAADNQAQLVGSTWVWWVDAMYQAVPDLNKYFDGVAVHPYGSDLTGYDYPTPGLAYNGYEQVRRIESIRQEFVNHGASRKPLWITEIGWPICTTGSPRCTSQAGQAADLTTVFRYAHTTWKPWLQALLVYSYDDARPNSTNPEDNYGMVLNNGGTPKPALNVFKSNNI